MFRRKNFCTFAPGKDKGFEFYRKIFELGPPNLQVPRCPCSHKLLKFNLASNESEVLHGFLNKRPTPRPSTKSFLIFGHILVLKVS